ncbi:di-copper centre-containing protein [Stemphylium lycopersici]|uniref:tyrosinase n=1 Tax=Stemphylium lycopersici TaxID=183478 RepID=A0A364NH37_STELY|nr:di-copper centre-containing protein [Stemphylium lycopersici]
MKSFASLLAGSVALLSSLGSVQAVLNFTNGSSCGVAKADDSYFSVVGVQGTGVHPRQELRELQKDTELWNIFLQAFARFQAMDQTEKISYYQVAGIHGVPFQPWDKVTGEPGQEMMGYCPHTSSIFGPWHRPYLALFEQVLHDRAVDVANEYPVGEARNKALGIAARVRVPYWDWAMDPPNPEEGVIPGNLRCPTVTITFPNGTVGDIPNPLYRYDFHPLNYDVFAPLSEFEFKDWNRTLRYPLHPYAANATSRNEEVNVRVGKQQPNLRDMLYKLLTTYQPFSKVSNKANGGTIGNFETLHDGLHNAFGLGHMGIVEVSAFDPVFWFHHCNIDRIMAIYQARYPDTWIEDAKQATGSFAVARGSVLGTASPLAPFHMNALGDMWTATTARNWTSFGYTYPEVAGNPSNATLTSSINRLYKSQTQGLSDGNATRPTPGYKDASNGTTQAIDWLCEVKMPTDIKISYSVRAFLGEPSSNPIDWPTDPNYVGQLASMSSPRISSSIIVTGNIGLSEKLAQKHAAGELKSLDKETVKAYLKEKFSWRIQALDYSEIPRNNPPAGLNVTVFNIPINVPESDNEVPTLTGNAEYNDDIEGNPPVYDGPGPDGTNSTLPVGQASGQYNAVSGEFEWKNATDAALGEDVVMPDPATETMLLESVITQYVTIGTSVVSASATSTTSETSSKAVTSEKAPEPTTPADPRTTVVTSVIMEYVTV